MEEEFNGEQNGLNGGCGDDNQQSLALTVALQQKEIDRLNEQMKTVLSRLDSLEGKDAKLGARPGAKSAPPAPDRRRTMDPKTLKTPRLDEDKTDGSAGSKRRTITPSSSSTTPAAAPPAGKGKPFQPKEKLPTIKDKEEPGVYRMFLAGRPVSFRLPEGYVQPTNAEPTPEPAQQLKMDWVYGYRGSDCRRNIWTLGSGEIVYFTAAVCIIQNIEGRTQRHYAEHTDDIKSLAVHPDRVTVATGQVAGHEKPAKGKGAAKAAATNPKYQPHIRIWNSATLETLKVVGAGALDRAVACLSFSVTDGGQLLCAVDEHNDHRMSIWDWNKGPKGTKLVEAKASQDAVYQADFHPKEANQIVCCGKNQLSFWAFDGKNLSKKMALFEKHDKPKFMTCLTFTPEGEVVTGDSNGAILVWSKVNNKISAAITNAHDGVVFCLYVTADGMLLSGGGKDRLVKTWDLKTKESTSSVEISEELGSARMLIKGDDGNFIIGTTKNSIAYGADLNQLTTVTQGHYDELWGLTESRVANQFYTCAHDKLIRLWNIEEHNAVWSLELPESLQCIAVNPAGDRLAVGSKTPNWYVYDSQSRQQVASGSCGTEQIEAAEFSPDSNFLALGSRDNSIYVYKIESDKYELHGRCQGHSSFITHIDWSTDGNFLRSNSGDYELLYWELANCKQYTEGDQIREMEFVTQNCVLALNTVGMWQKGADGTDINGCCVSHSKSLLASADDFGKVNLYSYPSRTPEAKCHSYTGHSSHVTNVRFSTSDQYLLSVGGKDSTVIQWALV